MMVRPQVAPFISVSFYTGLKICVTFSWISVKQVDPSSSELVTFELWVCLKVRVRTYVPFDSSQEALEEENLNRTRVYLNAFRLPIRIFMSGMSCSERRASNVLIDKDKKEESTEKTKERKEWHAVCEFLATTLPVQKTLFVSWFCWRLFNEYIIRDLCFRRLFEILDEEAHTVGD